MAKRAFGEMPPAPAKIPLGAFLAVAAGAAALLLFFKGPGGGGRGRRVGRGGQGAGNNASSSSASTQQHNQQHQSRQGQGIGQRAGPGQGQGQGHEEEVRGRGEDDKRRALRERMAQAAEARLRCTPGSPGISSLGTPSAPGGSPSDSSASYPLPAVAAGTSQPGTSADFTPSAPLTYAPVRPTGSGAVAASTDTSRNGHNGVARDGDTASGYSDSDSGREQFRSGSWPPVSALNTAPLTPYGEVLHLSKHVSSAEQQCSSSCCSTTLLASATL